jgi:hypothetical protein
VVITTVAMLGIGSRSYRAGNEGPCFSTRRLRSAKVQFCVCQPEEAGAAIESRAVGTALRSSIERFDST